MHIYPLTRDFICFNCNIIRNVRTRRNHIYNRYNETMNTSFKLTHVTQACVRSGDKHCCQAVQSLYWFICTIIGNTCKYPVYRNTSPDTCHHLYSRKPRVQGPCIQVHYSEYLSLPLLSYATRVCTLYTGTSLWILVTTCTVIRHSSKNPVYRFTSLDTCYQ